MPLQRANETRNYETTNYKNNKIYRTEKIPYKTCSQDSKKRYQNINQKQTKGLEDLLKMMEGWFLIAIKVPNQTAYGLC